MVTCIKCGTRNPRSAAFCVSCGAFLEWTGEVPAQQPPGQEPVAPQRPGEPAAGAPEPGGSDRAPGAPAGHSEPGSAPAGAANGGHVYVPPSAALEPATLAADPGEETAARVDVANRSGIVDQYSLDVEGVPREWVTVEPDALSLFPDDRGSFAVRVKPPRAATTPPGPMAFRLHVVSSADASIRTTLDGVVEVGSFQEMTAELEPYTSRGRTAGRHTVTVANTGNAEVPTILTGKNPDNLVRFRLKPDAVRVPAGGSARAAVVVRPRRWRWFSGGRGHQFEIVAQPEGGQPLTVAGIMEQGALLPGWAPRLAVGLGVAAVAAVLLRSTVFTGETETAGASRETTLPSLVATTAGLPPTVATTLPAVTTTVTPTTQPGVTTSVAPTSTTTATTLPPPKVVFVTTRQDGEQIWTMNTDGSSPVKLTSGPAVNTQPSFSPDHLSIAFVSNRDGNEELYVMKAGGADVQRLTNDPSKDNYPRWSPDGRRIVFARSPSPNAPNDSDLWVLDLSTSTETNITNSPGVQDTKPTWSSDGKSIAWERRALSPANQPTNIYILPFGPNVPNNPQLLVAGARHPAFSPVDPARIAYSNGTDVFVATVPASGPVTSPVALTANANVNVDPWWEPNGNRLVFVSLRDGNEEIYIMANNGTDQKRLTTTSAGTPQGLSLDRFPQL
jgi:hypothetical protein